jgi:hypothetical protein
MDGAETEGIGHNRLAERTCEFISARQPDQPQPVVKLKTEVGSALDGASPPYVDQMLTTIASSREIAERIAEPR